MWQAIKPDLKQLVMKHALINSGRAGVTECGYVIHVVYAPNRAWEGFVRHSTKCSPGVPIRVARLSSDSQIHSYHRICKRCLNALRLRNEQIIPSDDGDDGSGGLQGIDGDSRPG